MSAGRWILATGAAGIGLAIATISFAPVVTAEAQQVPCGVLKPCQCNDGVDNDNDGQVDFAEADPGCLSTTDNSEWDTSSDANGNPGLEPDFYPPGSPKLLGFNTFLSHWDARVTPQAERTQLQLAGARAQRFPIAWYPFQLNGPSQWDLSAFDHPADIAAELTSQSPAMTPVMVALSAPEWASDWATCAATDAKCKVKQQQSHQDFAPPTMAHVSDYAEFVRRLAALDRGAAIETWNEPNIPPFWEAKLFPQPDVMAAMQCAAYDAIKAESSSQVVLSPGFSWPGDPKATYSSFVRAMHGHMGRKCWDALSVHVYSGTHTVGDDSITALALRTVRTVQARYGDTSPIWVTETGSTTTGTRDNNGDSGYTKRTEPQQCTILRQVVNELMATPDVGAVFVHTLRNHPNPDTNSGANPVSAEYGFGLLEDGIAPSAFGRGKASWTHFTGVAGGTTPGC